MRARQREVALVMIEGDTVPIGGRVAGSTIRAETAAMLIVLGVAGITIRGRTFENIVLVAFLAIHLSMFPFQLERRQVVIELRGRPPGRSMACATVRAKLSLMRIILLMAGGTIGWCGL